MEKYFPWILLATVIMAMPLSFGIKANQLSYNYYKFSCLNLESVINSELLSLFLTDATAPAAFLRLMFHDCQVQGCDASILLDSNHLNHISEIISSRNFGIRKREMIDHIKSILEEECLGQDAPSLLGWFPCKFRLSGEFCLLAGECSEGTRQRSRIGIWLGA
ncbi:hypothetical protein VNO77_16300 [Canavalia gladiata]|uniref:peroxidase n=1 Tax=Canavalia gladiata TaxID=3824 RepID=A0AAN9M061_CANGL